MITRVLPPIRTIFLYLLFILFVSLFMGLMALPKLHGQAPPVPVAESRYEPPAVPGKRPFFARFVRRLYSPFLDKKLMAAMAFQYAAMTADGWTTSRVQNTCPICVEKNSLFLGRRPSDKRIAITLAASAYLQTQLVKFEKDWARDVAGTGWDRHFWDNVWLGHPAAVTVGHALAAKSNSRLFCPSGMQRVAGPGGSTVCTF